MKKRIVNLMLAIGMLFGQMPGIVVAAAESKELYQSGIEAEEVYVPADSSIPEDFENDLWLSSNFEVLEVGEEYTLQSRRVPQDVDSITTGNVRHPDYIYEVIEGDSITLEETQEEINSKINTINEAIKALERVKVEPIDATEIEVWAQAKMKLIENHYKEISPQTDWWMIANLGKRGHAPSSETLDYLKNQTIDAKTGDFKKDVNSLTKNILALRAAGIDVTNYYGHNLPLELSKLNISDRGLWAQAPAIWALNSDDYGEEVQAKVEEEISKLLAQQTETGVWNHWGWSDSTGFALYALAPFYEARDDVKQAVDKAVDDLSTKQNEHGEFVANNANSNAMIIGGLLSNNPELLTDARLVKDGKTMLDALRIYDIEGEPYFRYQKGSESMKEMATEQAFRALVTHFETQSDNGNVFDYRGTEKRVLSEPVDTTEIDAWAQTKMELIEDHYKDMSPQKDWWMIADLAKRGNTISDETLDFVKEGTIDQGTGKLSEDVGVLSKSILVLRAAGIDVTNYYGYNLPLELTKLDVRKWGIWTQGPAVWALNSDNYGIEITEKVNEEIESLLEQQREDGTWGDEWGWEDATGFALYALAPSYESREDVRLAVEKAVDGISSQQNNEGGFGDNSNSFSLVVGGLLSTNPDYLSDTRLIKNRKTMLHGLKEYDVKGKPLFNWKKDSEDSRPMATEQAFRALVTYIETKAGNGNVYDYRGTEKRVLSEEVKIGWIEEDAGWYYYSEDGTLETEWIVVENTWYYLDQTGLMQTGWKQVNGTWYYMNGSGAMNNTTGWNKIGRHWYYQLPSGAMDTGWTKVGNNWYYMQDNAIMQTGWTEVGNTWYYMSGSGAMQTGWTKVGNTWYYMSGSGAMQTGWTKVGNTWYYMTGSGAMQTGWTKVGNTWYYMSGSGAMQTGVMRISGRNYRFASSGRMI